MLKESLGEGQSKHHLLMSYIAETHGETRNVVMQTARDRVPTWVGSIQREGGKAQLQRDAGYAEDSWTGSTHALDQIAVNR